MPETREPHIVTAGDQALCQSCGEPAPRRVRRAVWRFMPRAMRKSMKPLPHCEKCGLMAAWRVRLGKPILVPESELDAEQKTWDVSRTG